MSSRLTLPEGVAVFERGWLSSNNVLLWGADSTALIDSGYSQHAEQTQSLVKAALQERPLDLLLNTHLHSDHCGGNAQLQAAYPDLKTLIPPGQSAHVQVWNPHALTYSPTGQSCPQFGFDAVLVPGTEIWLGGKIWQIHAAPGHDTHLVILFDAKNGVLISADALWERGFGVVFPELEGEDAFAAVGHTLDLIESLAPTLVIPGHGPTFTSIDNSIRYARERLDSFIANPAKHSSYAAKVLLKFKLLEVQGLDRSTFMAWVHSTPYFLQIFEKNFSGLDFDEWIEQLIDQLVRSGAASRDGLMIRNL